MTHRDRSLVRNLASQVAELAALPRQEETRRLWRLLNGLRPARPMVAIDQVCWNEMNVDDALTLRCEHTECRGYEDQFRRILLQARHFSVDSVVEPFLRVPKAIHNSGFGFAVSEEIAVGDPTNSVVGHKYKNLFQTDDDLDKVRMPCITHDAQETERRLDLAHHLFDGILQVRSDGLDPYLSIWDPISMWMGVENALYTMVDRPEFMHRLATRITDGYLSMLDQLEEQGLLCGPQSLIHCTGAWTDELPGPEQASEAPPRMRERWTFGLAQMFSTVSPAMFDEFEVAYASRICERFGLVYYGCCDPLDRKMAEVRKLPNVRKISMSPWADEERGAAEIGRDFVYSRKPNPALLAAGSFDEDAVRRDLQNTRRICERHGCPLEFILKDLSTVGYQPDRLFRWARIAMEVACGGL